jgi:uncharacterized protein YjbJ (UPF0337 family)
VLRKSWNIVQGNCRQIKGKVKTPWGRPAGYRGKVIAGNGDNGRREAP